MHMNVVCSFGAGGRRFRERGGVPEQAEEGPAQGGQEVSLAARPRPAAQELPQTALPQDPQEEVRGSARNRKRGARP